MENAGKSLLCHATYWLGHTFLEVGQEPRHLSIFVQFDHELNDLAFLLLPEAWGGL